MHLWEKEFINYPTKPFGNNYVQFLQFVAKNLQFLRPDQTGNGINNYKDVNPTGAYFMV